VRIRVPEQPREIVPIFKVARVKWTGRVAQVVECLLCKCKALSSNPTPTTKKKKKLQQSEVVVYTCNSSTGEV
jgi:hypothetical protein